MTAMKAKEKEMKDEKEDERQVRQNAHFIYTYRAKWMEFPEAYTSDQRQESSESRKGTL